MKIAPVGKAILFAAIFLTFLSGSLSLAQEEASEYAPPDTVFREMTLTDEGVTAVDTAGYDWYYDFTQGTFRVGVLGDVTDEGPEDVEGSSLDYLPVEERDSKEITPKPFVNTIVVGYDEYVDGEIIAYGRVTIRGWVKGDVTSIDGRVLVAASGQVDGDVAAPEIIVKDGGIVLGDQIIADLPDFKPGGSSSDGLIVIIVFTGVFIFFGFLVVTLMPQQTKNLAACVNSSRLKAYFSGLFFVLLMPFVLLLVTITIVGIVVLPIVVLAYIFAMIMGVVVFGDLIGRLIAAKFLGQEKSVLFQSMIGILCFMGLWFVTAALLSSPSDVGQGLGIFTLVLSICVSSYPILTGVGAAVMTRFGFKSYTGWKDRHMRAGLTPAPPPIPKAPPEPSPGAFDDDNEDETSGPSAS